MYLVTTAEALEYVRQFEDCTLPREKWTHEMHLIVGMYIVLTYRQNAVAEMKKRIWRYNEAKGKGNDNTGYHETLTVFWLWVVRRFCQEKGFTTFDEVGIDELIFDETLAKRKLVEEYYHIAVLMSPYARKHFCPPEFKDMEGVEYFLGTSK
jgi:hypothetical protein